MAVELKNAGEIDRMRAAGRIVAEILDALEAKVAPGVSTWELDQLAERLIREKGARPAFKGYRGFPAVLCTSLNHEVVHGIPSKSRLLAEGDLLKLDFGVVVDGFFGDAARTVPVGRISEAARRLSDATRASLEAGIRAMVAGNRVGDIGYAVQSTVEPLGFSVVRDFVGHGIGRRLHEAPQVPNYGRPGTLELLRPGMVLAVEPMVNAGTAAVDVLDDDWTAVTVDGRLSSHWEHTILVTDQGPEVLTRAPPGATG
jgi:methionyl aminopeptidase